MTPRLPALGAAILAGLALFGMLRPSGRGVRRLTRERDLSAARFEGVRWAADVHRSGGAPGSGRWRWRGAGRAGRGCSADPDGAAEHRLGGGADDRRSTGRRLWIGLLIAGAGGLALTGAGPRAVAAGCAVVTVAATGVWIRATTRRRTAAVRCRGRVIEACGVLAADLRAGRTPQEALHGAATICPELHQVAAAVRLGGDVGSALDRSSRTPGAEGLRALAAAWRVADRSGSALAGIAERIAESLRADDAVRRQVAAGLAGTRSTARLLAGLPLLGTGLGYAIGADPVAFLIGSPVGWACLASGLGLAVLGLTWVERLADSCESAR